MNKDLLIDRLYRENDLADEELLYLIKNIGEGRELLFENSDRLRRKHYSNRIFARALLEISSYCGNSCLYCGINSRNKNAARYRLDKDEILESCNQAYELGYRTFVLQGGEDPYYDDLIERIVYEIKSKYDDLSLTLSLGEKSYESYRRYYRAGADRYLLRHETADKDLFKRIHMGAEFEKREECLYMLKDIGYQVGAGFMVGIPGQTDEILLKDLRFLKKLEPEMVGIGPFIAHSDTVYRDEKSGDSAKTLLMLALVRNLLPDALIPATTALNTLDPGARNQGIKIAANVIMPNISPLYARESYSLYDNKAHSGSEAGEELRRIASEIEDLGFKLDMSKGDHRRWMRK